MRLDKTYTIKTIFTSPQEVHLIYKQLRIIARVQ